MYLADSISFEPSKTPRIFPKKKTTFSITFSPKLVQTTLEYFTIYSTNDHIVTDDDEHEESHGEIVQKYTVCVQGSCYGKRSPWYTYYRFMQRDERWMVSPDTKKSKRRELFRGTTAQVQRSQISSPVYQLPIRRNNFKYITHNAINIGNIINKYFTNKRILYGSLTEALVWYFLP